jgi:hypothetical protein
VVTRAAQFGDVVLVADQVLLAQTVQERAAVLAVSVLTHTRPCLQLSAQVSAAASRLVVVVHHTPLSLVVLAARVVAVMVPVTTPLIQVQPTQARVVEARTSTTRTLVRMAARAS